MRNKGFFWFLTAVIALVCVYQLSFTFVSNGIEEDAEKQALAMVDELEEKAIAENDTVSVLPNNTTVNFLKNTSNDSEAREIAHAAYVNSILKEKNEEKVYLGKKYKEVKNNSLALGLDLKGGMSVTLELSIPDLVKNAALNSRNIRFEKSFDKAMADSKGVDFIQSFADAHKELYPETPLIKEFLTEKIADEIGNKATDEQVVAYLKESVKGSLDGVEEIMNNRINQFGVAQPNISKDFDNNRLYIELPGVKDQATVRDRLQSTANLEFFETASAADIGDFLNYVITAKLKADGDDDTDVEASIVEPTDSTNAADTNVSAFDALADTAKTGLDALTDDVTTDENTGDDLSSIFTFYGQTDVIGAALLEDTAQVAQVFRENRNLLANENVRFVWGAQPFENTEDGTFKYTLYGIRVPVDGKALVGGNDIDEARSGFNQMGQKTVNVTMTPNGTQKWAEMTGANEGLLVAIVMDNLVYSAPRVNGVISGGNTEISGSFTTEEANGLASLLEAGALPAPCIITEEAIVGPTIGEENFNAGMLSFALALGVVLIYMIFYYGKAGIVADVALVANILFIIGSLASFGAVLTLAGIAGIVLTIGMSVDANVLIYERIREEEAQGKGMKQAVKDGYAKALSSIIDANVTTLLTAIVLKTFGSGPIESFATTLIIGIFTSVFAAVVITRLIFEWRISKGGKLSFTSSITKNWFRNINKQFVNNRKKFYIISSIICIAGIASLAVRGLSYNVEFTGGRSFITKFEKPVDIDKLTNVLTEEFKENGKESSVVIKSRTNSYTVDITTSYVPTITDDSLNTEVVNENSALPKGEVLVENKLKKSLDNNVEQFGGYDIESSRSVSSVISDELKSSSLISIVLSLIVIFVYILIRFGRWQYGLGALIAMGHDVLIVLSLFSLLWGVLPFSLDVDQAFIAAILTVVGYSINDTVVVFDRLREFLGIYKNKDRKEVINDALNSTLSRTINTSLSTFVVLLTIFIFGGDAIRGFIFALMVGVIVGTYSSLCIATPLVVDLTKKEDETKKIEE